MDTLCCGDTQAPLSLLIDPVVPVDFVRAVTIRDDEQDCTQSIGSSYSDILLERTRSGVRKPAIDCPMLLPFPFQSIASPYVWISKCNPYVFKDGANVWVDNNIGMSHKFGENQNTGVTSGFLSISG